MAKGLLLISIYVILAIMSLMNFPVSDNVEMEQEIAQTEAQISDYTEKLMYEHAISLYINLIDDYPENKEISDKYILYCEKYGYISHLQDECERRLDSDRDNKLIAEKLLDVYYKTGTNDIYTFMNDYSDLLSESELYIDIKKENSGNIKYIGGLYDNIQNWQSSGYTYTKDRDGKISVISGSGNTLVSSDYEEIKSYSGKEKFIAVEDNGQLVYVNRSGIRQLVPYNTADKELVYLDYAGPFVNGIANVSFEGKWGYMNSELNFAHMKYKKTTPFSCGISAVCDEGGWKIVNTSFAEVSSQVYEDVYCDEYGYCCFNNIIFLKNGGKWQLYNLNCDEEGSPVSLTLSSDAAFDDVKSFGEYGAVKQNGKWGFIKKDGKWLIEPAYDDAYSFRCGLAPVKIGDKWGYISEEGTIVIEAIYDGAISFSENGVSSVKQEDTWKLIQLVEYYYIGR